MTQGETLMSCVLFENTLHITAFPETRLDTAIEDAEVAVKGYNQLRHVAQSLVISHLNYYNLIWCLKTIA